MSLLRRRNKPFLSVGFALAAATLLILAQRPALPWYLAATGADLVYLWMLILHLRRLHRATVRAREAGG